MKMGNRSNRTKENMSQAVGKGKTEKIQFRVEMYFDPDFF